MSEIYRLGRHEFRSRLIVGSGKYASFPLQLEATRESGISLCPSWPTGRSRMR